MKKRDVLTQRNIVHLCLLRPLMGQREVPCSLNAAAPRFSLQPVPKGGELWLGAVIPGESYTQSGLQLPAELLEPEDPKDSYSHVSQQQCQHHKPVGVEQALAEPQRPGAADCLQEAGLCEQGCTSAEQAGLVQGESWYEPSSVVSDEGASGDSTEDQHREQQRAVARVYP